MVDLILNPFADPLGFIIFYFLFTLNVEGFVGVLKLGLMSSIITFPFVYMGTFLFKKLQTKIHEKWRIPFITYYITGLGVIIAFWAAIKIWYMLFSPQFAGMGDTGFGDIVKMWLIASVVVYPFMLVGSYIKLRLESMWKMPQPLLLYVITLVLCVVFWTILWLFAP